MLFSALLLPLAAVLAAAADEATIKVTPRSGTGVGGEVKVRKDRRVFIKEGTFGEYSPSNGDEIEVSGIDDGYGVFFTSRVHKVGWVEYFDSKQSVSEWADDSDYRAIYYERIRES